MVQDETRFVTLYRPLMGSDIFKVIYLLKSFSNAMSHTAVIVAY